MGICLTQPQTVLQTTGGVGALQTISVHPKRLATASGILVNIRQFSNIPTKLEPTRDGKYAATPKSAPTCGPQYPLPSRWSNGCCVFVILWVSMAKDALVQCSRHKILAGKTLLHISCVYMDKVVVAQSSHTAQPKLVFLSILFFFSVIDRVISFIDRRLIGYIPENHM